MQYQNTEYSAKHTEDSSQEIGNKDRNDGTVGENERKILDP
jgi:hypothetical protein